MSEIQRLLPLVQTLDIATFATTERGYFLVRQRSNEIEEPTGVFKTPVQVPIVSPDQTLQPVPRTSSSSTAVRALNFRTLDDIVTHFAVHPVVKSARNAFGRGITLGRTQNNDIVVPVRTVSKFHAWLFLVGNRWYCEDAQSSYGTSVDQVLLSYGERRPVDLGSRVKIGDVSLTLVDGRGLHQWLTQRLALIKK